ncbi:hypothetical protein AX16_000885, partial [Volvariella volvacea WC 439]
GLLVLDPFNTLDTPQVYIRPSQMKIKYTKDESNIFQHMIHVLQALHSKISCCLSTEVIINLAENGVSPGVFINLLKNGLQKEVFCFLKWDELGAMINLAYA